MRRDLDEIRRAGYAVSVGELSLGSASMSAPFRNAMGEVVGALTITAPETRAGADVLRSWQEPLLRAARLLSTKLGHLSSQTEISA